MPKSDTQTDDSVPIHGAKNIGYDATTPEDWPGIVPRDVHRALDKLAKVGLTEHHISLISGGAFDVTGFV